MSGLFGSAKSGSGDAITGLQVGTSSYGVVLPLVFGATRIGPNTAWMPHEFWKGWHDDNGAGKGGGGGDGTLNHFSQGVMLAICEGPIPGLGRVWRDKEVFSSLSQVKLGSPFSLFLGARPQSPWSFLASGSLTDSRNFTATVSVGTTSITIADPWFSDADPSAVTVVSGYNVTQQYSVQSFQTVTISTPLTRVTGTPGAGQFQLVGQIVNLGTLPGPAGDKQVVVSYGLNVPYSKWALGYGGTTYVASAGLDLGSSNALKNFSFEPLGLLSGGIVTDVNPADVVNVFLTNAVYGAGWDTARVDAVNGLDGTAASGFQRYCAQSGLLLSPAFTEQKAALEHLSWVLEASNAEPLWANGKLSIIPMAEAQIGTFVPVTSPQYDLTPDHFLGEDGGAVEVENQSSADVLNIFPVEYLERNPTADPVTGAPADPAAPYNVCTVEEPEAADSSLNGEKRAPAASLHCITTGAVAQAISRIKAQRSVYYESKTYRFSLGARFSMLEPTDLITLTDSNMGLDHVTVRIRTIEEDENGDLHVEAEPWLGTPHPTLHATQTPDGGGAKVNAYPYSANPPIMVMLPAAMTSGPTIAIGTSGASKDWGGAEVWTSWDGSSFAYAGDVRPCVHGRLTSALAAGAPLDTTGTLQVDLSLSSGQLPSATAGDRDGFVTACWVDGEVVSYATSALVSGYTYNLTSLRRGAYGTVSGAHLAGSSFLRLNSNVLQVPIPASRAGGTLYVKLASFNLTRSAMQDISSVPVYAYAIPASATAPDVLSLPIKISWDQFDVGDWSLGTAAGKLSLQSGAVLGGNVLRCAGGELWMTTRRNLPVDAAKVYKLHVRYRQVSDPVTGHKYFTAGLAGVAADGITLVDKTGGTTLTAQHFYPDSVQNVANDGWHDYVAYWYGLAATGTNGGTSSAAAGQLQTNVRYVRPLLAFNVGGGDSTIEVDSLDLEEVSQAEDLADGAVTLPKLSVGYGMNILSNGDFCAPSATSAPSGWTFTSASYGTNGVQGINLADVWTLGGNSADISNSQSRNTAWIHQLTGPTSPSNYQVIYSGLIPVEVGQNYMASVYSGGRRCKVTVLLRFTNAAGTGILDCGNGATAASANDRELDGGASLASFKRIYCSGVAPTGAAFVYFELLKYDTAAGQTDSWGFFCRAQLEPVGPNVTTPSPWSSAGRTIIDGSGIVTASLTADKISAISLTADKITIGSTTVTNLWFGQVSPYLGYLNWTGSLIAWSGLGNVGSPSMSGNDLVLPFTLPAGWSTSTALVTASATPHADGTSVAYVKLLVSTSNVHVQLFNSSNTQLDPRTTAGIVFLQIFAADSGRNVFG
jgi:hypothetical protein